MEEVYVGYHARSIEEFERVISLKGVNLVELKPENFTRNQQKLYSLNKGVFRPNHELLKDMSQKAKDNGIRVQVHLPFEETIDTNVETGICQAIESHHPLWLQRLEMFRELQYKYTIGNILTTHGPAYKLSEGEICSVNDAIKIGRELYLKADDAMIDGDYGFIIGIENVVGEKLVGGLHLGHEALQIGELTKDTSNIRATIDSGHRKLNSKMSISELVSRSRICNVHFHSNPGEVNLENYKDDEHLFAYRDGEHKLPNYDNYIRRIRMDNLPVVLEISRLDKHSNEFLSDYVINLKKEISKGRINF